jgi:hypothetical protein
MEGEMDSWILPHISAYWDQRVDAIERLSRAFAAVPKAEKEQAFNAIYDAVAQQADKLSVEDMCRFAVAMVDDVYKTANQLTQFDQDHLRYLTASAAAFLNSITRRGYMIHYFTNNTFNNLMRPVRAFPIWFKAAHTIYICPQELAAEGSTLPEEWPPLIERNLAATRTIANDVAGRLREQGRSFVFLDVGATEIAAAEISLNKPGVIWAFRADAPSANTPVKIAFPSQPRTAAR